MHKCLQSKQIHSFVEIQPRTVDVRYYQVVSLTLWAESFHHLSVQQARVSGMANCACWKGAVDATHTSVLTKHLQESTQSPSSPLRSSPFPTSVETPSWIRTAKVWSQDKVLGCSVKKWSMPLIQIPVTPPALDFPKSSPDNGLCKVYSDLQSAGCLITGQDLPHSYTEIVLMLSCSVV